MNYKDILKLEFYSNDFYKRITIGYYLEKLLLTLLDKNKIEEGESFSGKHPFGNSDWESDIAICLVENNIIEGKIERYKDNSIISFDYDWRQYAKIMSELIHYIFVIRNNRI